MTVDNYSEANDIVVHNNNVYVVGYEGPVSARVVKLWKNGIPQELPDAVGTANAIAIK